MQIIPFTKIGYENLKKELDEQIKKRPENVKSLSRGREMGDLSENGLYKAAKQELSDLDRNIRHLKYLLLYGKSYSPSNNNMVSLGHKVIIKTGKTTREYEIVGEYEANPKDNKISLKSPIGHNLMGKKAGDFIKVNTPGGQTIIEIVKIYS